VHVREKVTGKEQEKSAPIQGIAGGTARSPAGEIPEI